MRLVSGVRRNPLLVGLLLLVALGLRAWGIGDFTRTTGDEGNQIPAAKHFIRYGHSDGTNWHHPPLGLVLLGDSIEILGDNVFGWRIRNLVLGGLTPVLLYLVALELFSSEAIALVAALLLALDPLHIFLSRSTMDEIPAVFFFLPALWIVLRYMRGVTDTPVLAGFLIGFSLATKEYYLPAAGVLFIFTLAARWKKNGMDVPTAVHLVLVFLVLPSVILLASYFQWFAAGHGLRDFVQLQIDSQRDLQNMTYDWFLNGERLRRMGTPWEWFVLPKHTLFFGQETGAFGLYMIVSNNPAIWLWTLPSIAFQFVRWVQGKDSALKINVMLFFSAFVPLLLVKRPIFLYSAVTVLPLAFMAMAYSLETLKTRMGRGPYRFFIGAVLCLGLYYYPLVSAKYVPTLLYTPVLALAGNP